MASDDTASVRSVVRLLGGALDEVRSRQRSRLAGLTQEEYLWEPVPGCWTVSEHDGAWHVPARARPEPVPAPVTTIAWRLWHIASDCLADYTERGLGPRPLLVAGTDWYGRVDEALIALEHAWTGFREGVEALGDDGIWSPLGERWGPYAREPWAALVLHALDEVAHYGAEIGLLRDLYARRDST
jgi:DinB superfamily